MESFVFGLNPVINDVISLHDLKLMKFVLYFLNFLFHIHFG